MRKLVTSSTERERGDKFVPECMKKDTFRDKFVPEKMEIDAFRDKFVPAGCQNRRVWGQICLFNLLTVKFTIIYSDIICNNII